MKFVPFALLVVSFASGCANASGVAVGGPATRPLMDRYIEVMGQPESRQRQVDLATLRDEYWEAVMLRPARKGRAQGIITDDRGLPIDGVSVTIGWHNPPDIRNLTDRPAKRQTIVVDHEFDVDMDGYHGVGLQFRKPGYADIGWWVERGRSHADTSANLKNHFDSSSRSSVEARSDGGPGVRIVMYPEHYEWDPAGQGECFEPDKKLWPKQVPANAPTLLRSEAWDTTAVSQTGTYVVTDKAGNVVLMVRLRRGSSIGFRDTSPGGKGVQIWYKRNSDTLPLERGPYAWRLYSVAKPIYPTTQPAR